MRALLSFFLCCSLPSFGQVHYIDSLTTVRKQHQVHLLQSKETPLNEVEIQQIDQLSYFPIDLKNVVEASFKKKIKAPFDLPTSSGKSKKYRKFGEISFQWNGEQLTLNVYQDMNLIQQETYKDYLIIPFKDATSGQETYGGGRYLDFKRPKSKTVRIDFNTVYNPFCVYSFRFNCPIPPTENHLKIKIEAGEKTPQFKH